MSNRRQTQPLTVRCARALREPATVAAVARRLRIDQRAVRSALDHLRARGCKVERTAPGIYRVWAKQEDQ